MVGAVRPGRVGVAAAAGVAAAERASTALHSRSGLTSFVTYDKPLLDAAQAAGLPSRLPCLAAPDVALSPELRGAIEATVLDGLTCAEAAVTGTPAPLSVLRKRDLSERTVVRAFPNREA